MGRAAAAPPPRTITASELAEFAYCPRAWWYSAHPPSGGPEPQSLARAAEGRRFHDARLGAVERREAWGAAAVAAAIAALLLIAATIAWAVLGH